MEWKYKDKFLDTVKNIHQILILDDGKLPNSLPESLALSGLAARACYPNHVWHLWSGKELEQLLKDRMKPEVLEAWHLLRPLAYRADLARCVLLWLFGGLYVDMAVVLQRPWHLRPSITVAACRDCAFISPNWLAIQNGLMWAKPAQPEFRIAIDMIISNVRSRYYGVNPLYPTGPVVVGRAFAHAQLEIPGRQSVGWCEALTPEASVTNLAYFTEEGELLALRKKRTPGDLSHLGVKNGNNYNELWHGRAMYAPEVLPMQDENKEPVKKYLFSSWPAGVLKEQDAHRCLHPCRLGIQTDEGLKATIPRWGRVCYGPYTILVPGKYEIRTYFKVNSFLRGNGGALRMMRPFRDLIKGKGKKRGIVEVTQGENHLSFQKKAFYDSDLHTISLPSTMFTQDWKIVEREEKVQVVICPLIVRETLKDVEFRLETSLQSDEVFLGYEVVEVHTDANEKESILSPSIGTVK